MMLRKRTFTNVRTARNVRTSADAALRYAAPQVRIEYSEHGLDDAWGGAVVGSEKSANHIIISSGMSNKNESLGYSEINK